MKRGDEITKMVGLFMDSNDKIRVDSFHDLSYGRREAFGENI